VINTDGDIKALAEKNGAQADYIRQFVNSDQLNTHTLIVSAASAPWTSGSRLEVASIEEGSDSLTVHSLLISPGFGAQISDELRQPAQLVSVSKTTKRVIFTEPVQAAW